MHQYPLALRADESFCSWERLKCIAAFSRNAPGISILNAFCDLPLYAPFFFHRANQYMSMERKSCARCRSFQAPYLKALLSFHTMRCFFFFFACRWIAHIFGTFGIVCHLLLVLRRKIYDRRRFHFPIFSPYAHAFCNRLGSICVKMNPFYVLLHPSLQICKRID